MRSRENRSKLSSVLETVVSPRALQMGNSFPCRTCGVGFIFGVCLTTLFLVALSTSGSFGIGRISFSSFSIGITSTADTSKEIDHDQENKVSFLYSAWGALLNESMKGLGAEVKRSGNGYYNYSYVPKAPHLENCKLSEQVNRKLDKRVENQNFPPWTLWKLGLQLDTTYHPSWNEQLKFKGAYPPWIKGSDEENYPLTRKVQRDLWMHQHPQDCKDPNVKFLVADWETWVNYGMGAQFQAICGLFAMAITEKRVLVTNYYNRADHHGCKGSSRSSWSCYFFPETSQKCRDRAFQLMKDNEAWEKGIITGNANYTSIQLWFGAPRAWGEPWTYMQPTVDVNGRLVASHSNMDLRWWRAQALRYLMRFQTEYTCNLLNAERHATFGWEAAKWVVLATPAKEWLKEVTEEPQFGIERFVWSNHKPWIPRPLLSMHVRMGDKASEMKMVGFEVYMGLAERLRKRFPHVHNILVSTEMQEVIDKLRSYPHWNFYYTIVQRQTGKTSMADYTTSLGRELSTNYPMVNFLMAVDSDFFIGALGSTWSYFIDGMRNTGGKVMAGYLSVNKDRLW